MMADWYDHGNKGNKKEAERFASWMRRGGFNTRLVKHADGWHVETGTGGVLSAKDAQEHASDTRQRTRFENPPPSPFTVHDTTPPKSPATNRPENPTRKGETERGFARDMLGMSGGKPEPSSASGFGRWLQRHERKRKAQRDVALTLPVEPKEPERESPRNKVAEGAADIELAETIRDPKASGMYNESDKPKLRQDANKHFLFRTHRYLPSMTSTKPTKVSGGGSPQIEPGAYRRQRSNEPKGLYNMEHDPDRRN